MLKRLLTLGLAAALAAMPLAAAAQSWQPSQPIRWIVPFPPGGQAEIATRIIAEHIGPVLGQPVLVEAKPGANGNIGSEEVVRSTPDGHVWLSSGVPLSTAQAMYAGTLAFDPAADLIPVVRVGNTTFVMVVPKDVPVATLEEFVAYAKQNDLTYAASGIGSLVHLGSEMFKLQAGIELQGIPYNGQPPAVTDVLANRVQFMIMGLALALPHIQSGDIKPLAVLDAERHAALPDVPTVVEAGYPEMVMGGWMGLHVPAGTPDEIVNRISEVVNAALEDQTVIDQLTNAGWGAVPPNTPAEFKTFFENEVAAWKDTVEKAGVPTQ